MSRALAMLSREIVLAWGRGGGPLVSLGFYAGVATLLPLATGPEPARLAAVAPGAAWVALALAALLSLDRLFERDFEDGALDLLTLSPLPLEIACAIKCLGQWLATGAPLALAAPRSLWLLDEPLSPLDADWRARFGDLMAEHLAGGGLIVAAVHDPLPVPALAVEIAP